MMMGREIYYLSGYPFKPAPFEVLKVTDETLTVKFLENLELSQSGKELFSRLDADSNNRVNNYMSSRAGKEFTIPNRCVNGDSLIERLRSGGVAPYYSSSRIGNARGLNIAVEDNFCGNLFGYDPSKKE